MNHGGLWSDPVLRSVEARPPEVSWSRLTVVTGKDHVGACILWPLWWPPLISPDPPFNHHWPLLPRVPEPWPLLRGLQQLCRHACRLLECPSAGRSLSPRGGPNLTPPCSSDPVAATLGPCWGGEELD
ncbi:hypothetical protein NDU88_003066 [Pleurodeles waltl]|uniref:Uncharacterized protein n=1 Tax=Pleurodeles waltl TaxID=8319 RepID=A0AAV7MPH5_PLEWA|nr:hypothetical protein NDU88_003066 [Pleurodeles waltl]